MLTAMRPADSIPQSFAFLPDNRRIAPFLLGFHTTYAAYIWIETILYFGSHVFTDRQFPYLVSLVDAVTKLNPQFYPAYEFAGVIIPRYTDSPDAARVILNRGINHVSTQRAYKLAFYLGWLYYNHYQDYALAGEYLALAASHPKAPPYLAGLAARAYTNAGERQTAVQFLRYLYDATENPSVRYAISEKLTGMLKD
ncbi:MAG: hypothetical protein ACLFSB_11610 [Chitinispirillaceae bacterium]